ncbi:uncharacterized protein [Triticum aestivum]|uniref:uncharacterized protein n=1 Tax=Triticum aestivum TaxID=4565 RepID=UPI001D00BAF7|nr:uncharacterized protein LOC123093504 [Triticum aestivum]
MEISASVAPALGSGSTSAANDQAACLGVPVPGGGGAAAAASGVASPEPVVRPLSPDMRPSEEGLAQPAAERALSDVEFSGGSCTTFSSGGGDAASGGGNGAAPPAVSQGSTQSVPLSAQASHKARF